MICRCVCCWLFWLIKIKNTSSGGTTRSHNSGACSVERTITSDRMGLNSSKISYINERRQRSTAPPQTTLDERYDFSARPRRVMKGIIPCLMMTMHPRKSSPFPKFIYEITGISSYPNLIIKTIGFLFIQLVYICLLIIFVFIISILFFVVVVAVAVGVFVP